MIGKIILLALVAASQARHVDVQVGTVPSDRCPPVGHHLLSHEWDCTKFYYCEYGEKWLAPRDCAPGSEFSYALQVCVHPAVANCELPGVPPESEEVTEEPGTEAPTEAPTEPETEAPTEAPTTPPSPTTEAPTEAPTEPETEAPTEAPTEPETEAPTEAPTTPPSPTTETPTEAPTEPETEAPTEAPTEPETEAPTEAPTTPETEAPTEAPTEPETEAPTEAPTTPETETPTEAPTEPETEAPTEAPTTPPSPTTEAPTEPETEAPTEAPELLPNGCPADFDVHKLLPHETRCDKFYYCVNGDKVEKACSTGLWFNPDIQVCDWPDNVDCINAVSSESSEDLEGSGDPEIDNKELLPNGCPADFEVHKLLPHESECSKFYYCVLGETVERECTQGTLFNAALQVCDWPENVDCINAVSSESSEDLEGSGDPEIDNEELLPNGCPADFEVHKLLPHESECSKFYYCVLGETVERECAKGTLFNAQLQVCDWPENAGCTNSGNGGENSQEAETEAPTEAPTEQELLPNGCPADFDVHQLLPHETDCAKFYYCVHGEKVDRDCTGGLWFNPALQVCDWPQNAGCTIGGGEGSAENNSEENVQTPSDICQTSCNIPAWAHEQDCDKFWRCDGDNAVLGTCSEGLHFNVSTRTCDFIDNVGCVRDAPQNTPERDGLKMFLPWNKMDKTIRAGH